MCTQVLDEDEVYYALALFDHLEKYDTLRKAADQGQPEAQYDFAMFLMNDMNEVLSAVEWLQKAGEQGHAEAALDLSQIYGHGDDGVEQNEQKAVEWLMKAAERGSANARYDLGRRYHGGRGMDQDGAKAVEWFKKCLQVAPAPTNDNGQNAFLISNAQNELARHYADGDGVEQDDAKAVEWFTKAAEHGNLDAQYKLGVRYAEGHGVAVNFDKAVAWLGKASGGHDQAKLYLKDALSKKETVALQERTIAAQKEAFATLQAENERLRATMTEAKSQKFEDFVFCLQRWTWGTGADAQEGVRKRMLCYRVLDTMCDSYLRGLREGDDLVKRRWWNTMRRQVDAAHTVTTVVRSVVHVQHSRLHLEPLRGRAAPWQASAQWSNPDRNPHPAR